MLSLSSKFALWYHSITYRWEWWQWEWSQWKVNMLLIFKRFLSKSFSRKLLHLLFFPFFVSFIFLKPEILQCLKMMNGLLHLKWKKSYAKDLNSWNLQSNRLSKINLRVKFLLFQERIYFTWYTPIAITVPIGRFFVCIYQE